MRIYQDIAKIDTSRRSALTVGTFDGFHLGHQVILDQIKNIAAANSLLSTIVTFEPHPKKVVGKPGMDVRILTTTKEKLQIFEEAGIDQALVIPFTKEFAAKTSGEFVEQILVNKLAVAEMVIGHDHHFGHNREGGLEELERLGRKFGFTVHEVSQFEKDGKRVSSTMIRSLIENGEVEQAARFMGRRYIIYGLVKKGDGRGKEIGFPTANIEVDHEDKLVPARGVYAVDVNVAGHWYKGMMNIGIRPTFDIDSLTLEVHIFNLNINLYGKEIAVRFKKYIRKEKKFPGIEELRLQLQRDKTIAEKI